MKAKTANFIAFDIGSSKIAAMAANISRQGEIKIITQALHYSKGFKSGIITDINAAENSIIAVIYALEKECEKSIKEVTVSLSGAGVKSYYVTHSIKLGNQPISKSDLKKLVQKAITDFKVKDQEMIHYFPIEFILDGKNVVDNPIGLYGRQLSCQLHIIAANSLMLLNLTHCFARCQVEVNYVMLAIYASGLACLTKEEQKLGSIIIDIGSKTTSFAIFLNNKVIYVGYVPLGSSDITTDIAKFFSISLEVAEKIKILYGHAIPSIINKVEVIRIEQFQEDNAYSPDLTITSTALDEVIYPRMKEILEQIQIQYNYVSMDHLLARRLIITGGGASLPGTKNLAANIFGKQVRIAKPENFPGYVENYNPYIHSTVMGILKSRASKYQKNSFKPDYEDDKNWLRKTFLWLRENI